MKDVLDKILKLSTEDKFRLVEAIWDNIAEEGYQDNTVSEEEKNILNDRLMSYKRNPDRTRSWDEFAKDFLKNYQ